MPALRTTLKLTNLTFTALAVIAAIATLFLWLNAIVWGGTYAYAEALTGTVFTVVLFGIVIGVEKAQEWGE